MLRVAIGPGYFAGELSIFTRPVPSIAAAFVYRQLDTSIQPTLLASWWPMG
jgi:hypothetical protein